jgi:tetratricopeptide (TPR) repeat protein
VLSFQRWRKHLMRTTNPALRRNGRRAFAALALSAVLPLAACSRNDAGSLPQPDAKKAASELQTGLQAQSSGDLDGAARHYQETLKYDPKNKYALYNLAVIDAVHANYAQAEQKYEVVLGIDPAYAPALFNLAILRKNSGDSAQAVTLYRRVLATNPKYAAAHMNLGLLLRSTGKSAEGDAEVKKAIELDPQLKDPAARTVPGPSSTARRP